MPVNVVVLVKPVPLREQDITIREDGSGINLEELKYGINEWDNYALEEGLLIKEKFGGKVFAVTLSSKQRDPEFLLRECYAKGVDSAILIHCEESEEFDPYLTAKVIYEVVKDLEYDLILCGVQAFDDNYTLTGAFLAELLNLPHASIITKLELLPDKKIAVVRRELEAGVEEEVEVDLPALFTVQTGINQPRYASLLKLRSALKKEIRVLGLNDLGMEEKAVLDERKMVVRRMYRPIVKKETNFLEGSAEEVSRKLIEILREKGVLSG